MRVAPTDPVRTATRQPGDEGDLFLPIVVGR